MAGAVLGGTWGFFAFPMMDTKNDLIILAAITIGLLFHALMYAGQPAIMAEMFPTRMRYSGVSLGYQVTSIVAGSLAPIIATALLSQFKSSIPVAIYLLGACLVTSSRCSCSRKPAASRSTTSTPPMPRAPRTSLPQARNSRQEITGKKN